MPNLTKIAAWAESIGISRQSGYEAVNRCAIPVTDGKVDPDVANLLYAKGTRARAKGKNATFPAGAGVKNHAKTPAAAAEDGPSGYDVSRARREAAEAEMSQMKLAEMQGKYLLKTDVADAIFEIARALRDGLTNSARRIAAEVASVASVEECEVVIDRENRALLESMNHSLEAKLRLGDEHEDNDA
ncbi:MAG: hypothetical protein M3Y65_16395 [Pseudomonadota bacterium]|nr:hypothetical protein [Pseudomonadota bacterium]